MTSFSLINLEGGLIDINFKPERVREMGKRILGCLALMLGLLSASSTHADILDIDTSALDARTAALVEQVEARFMNDIANDFSEALPRFFSQQLTKIQVTAVFDPNADGVGGVLASASITESLDYSSQFANISVAQAGQMNIDQADADALSDNDFMTVVMHELFHAVGFSNDHWERNDLIVNGFQYVGQNAVEAFRVESGIPFAPFVPVETGGGAGTAGSHWAENVPGLQGPGFQDLMQGFADFSNDIRISGTTIGAIRDVHLTMTERGFQGPASENFKIPPGATDPFAGGGAAGAGTPFTGGPANPFTGTGGAGPSGGGGGPTPVAAVSAVPEPTGATLLVLGVLGMAVRRRRA